MLEQEIHISQDTAAVLRAIEVNADAILKGTRVDGIYTADPEKDKNAVKFDTISYQDVLNKGLKVMDMTAFTLSEENKLPIIVFDMNTSGNLFKLVRRSDRNNRQSIEISVMNEEIDFIIDAAKEQMQHAIEHLVKELRSIRAGKATPSMLSTIMVDYYGSQTPLSQVANVNTPDARTISVQPWEKNMLQEIEKAIMVANIGFNPMNNGESIMINVPPLTEERRKDLVKQAKAEAEHAKVGVRNARKEANNDLKKLDISEDLKKNTETDIQALTDSYVQQVDQKLVLKEKEIMTV